MKVLVTGAAGMLGTALCKELAKKGYEVSPTDIGSTTPAMDYLDITDLKAVNDFIKRSKPDLIFHAAAETDVDRCEIEVDHAYKINTLGTENVALSCQRYDIAMVYVSTCGVFDGTKEAPYNEFDAPSPISIYTKSKYEGEKAVRCLLRRYFIFRAGWMIGGGKKDKKFVAKIVELLKTKDAISVVNDKFGCPTYTKDFSEGMLKVVDLARYGLYHITNEGQASRYDIACKIVEYLKKNNVAIKPISSAAFPLPAPRPRSEVVDNYKLKLLGIKMRPWEEALREYLNEFNDE
ncbi:MAG: dTDP-4-dehydrorhamnose reductase [Candidatus Omnitrophica bacterium]|nr:dTDP-4-dehydrorhamnose reductase [Candidatus Omnitrophota bacterium]MDD5552849.1 dTDP-4-dehydrorhamnose reductase [Candidatus Omnitrophota bacterium]